MFSRTIILSPTGRVNRSRKWLRVDEGEDDE